jgi:uncharacterized protein (TIGR04255 family)
VSIGIQFEPLERLRIPHYGSLWERLRKDYPTIEHAAPIVNKDNSYNLDSNTGLPLPRVWFINQTETRLIQIQANRINFNWRIRDSADSYPRYPEIASNFFKNLDLLEKFLVDYDIGLIQPKLAELTYINIFEPGKEWNSAKDTAKIFNDFQWAKNENRFLPEPQDINWTTTFPLPENKGKLSAKVNNAKRVSDDKTVLQLEMTASNNIDNYERKSIESWFELAHEWIVKGFVDLTKSEVQEKYWGREK